MLELSFTQPRSVRFTASETAPVTRPMPAGTSQQQRQLGLKRTSHSKVSLRCLRADKECYSEALESTQDAVSWIANSGKLRQKADRAAFGSRSSFQTALRRMRSGDGLTRPCFFCCHDVEVPVHG